MSYLLNKLIGSYYTYLNLFFRTPEAISPGDVIDDIENMLANLSDQLDAMLDEEVQK